MDNRKRYLIIPDVHGRDFYENALEDALRNGTDIIFLGDYIDPYQNEGIKPDDALERLKSIIKLKKDYPDRITLLIGNHDFHYIDGSRRGCRMDHYNKGEICGLYIKNIDLFDYVKAVTVNGVNYLFSHAGFLFDWFDTHFDIISGKDVYDDNEVNDKFTFDFVSGVDWKAVGSTREGLNAFGEVGYSRGGWTGSPSFIWADVSDMILSGDVKLKDCVQVVGHSQRQKGMYIGLDWFYMLDCKCMFYIMDDGSIVDEDVTKLENNGEEYRRKLEEAVKRFSWFV